MSIAVLKTLLSGDYSIESFAKYFVEQFKLDPRKGYAAGFSGNTVAKKIRKMT